MVRIDQTQIACFWVWPNLAKEITNPQDGANCRWLGFVRMVSRTLHGVSKEFAKS
jgi:hypothetical protein